MDDKFDVEKWFEEYHKQNPAKEMPKTADIKVEEHVIDDSNEKWKAVVVLQDTVAALCFETKPSGTPIQGNVDDTLGYEEIKIGIGNLELTADDGSFIVDFVHFSAEQKQQIKQPVLKYLTKLYTDNKKKFSKNIMKESSFTVPLLRAKLKLA